MGGQQSRHQDQYNFDPYTNYGGPPSYPSFLGQRYQSSESESVSHSSTYFDYDQRSHLQSRYSRIDDNYHSLDQVAQALVQAGLESSNLIVGIDFTKSNEWTGTRSFNRKSLHHLGDALNPYEQAISILGRTLSQFDEDNLIPCYGFGDSTTHDQHVFSFYSEDRPCNGFEEVLSRYKEIVPHVHLAGPTSFAPIIETAVGIVDSSGGLYHVLVIIADGQVTRSVDTGPGQLSPQEQSTINAIVKASQYPLSIVLVGVGDGPWHMMHKFDDNIPSRSFDNFQFVNFTEIMSKNIPLSKKQTEFALAALMEIPSQYKATLALQLLGCQRGTPERHPLPPPSRNSLVIFTPNRQSITNEQITESLYYPPITYSDHSSQGITKCPICKWSKKDLAFGCGHQTCYDCGRDLYLCPICHTNIITRIKLYD